MRHKRYNPSRHPVLWIIGILQSLIVLVPLSVIVVWCFATSWAAPSLLPSGIGLQNIETVISITPDFPELLLGSVALSLGVSIVCVLISLLVGHALAFYDFKGKYLLDFLTFLPVIIPATAFGMGMHVFFLRVGLAGTILGVALVHIIVLIPYSIKIMTDSLRLLGRPLYEQAWSFGASPLRAFIDVALPPMIPSIVSALSLVFIGSFGQYFLTLIIGGGKVQTLALAMFPWVTSPDRGTAAVFACIYLLVSLIVFIALDFVGKKASKNQKTYLM